MGLPRQALFIPQRTYSLTHMDDDLTSHNPSIHSPHATLRIPPTVLAQMSCCRFPHSSKQHASIGAKQSSSEPIHPFSVRM
jgi:hypothetical protein